MVPKWTKVCRCFSLETYSGQAADISSSGGQIIRVRGPQKTGYGDTMYPGAQGNKNPENKILESLGCWSPGAQCPRSSGYRDMMGLKSLGNHDIRYIHKEHGIRVTGLLRS